MMGAVKNFYHDEICQRGELETDDRPLPPIATATPQQTIVLLERAAELLATVELTVCSDIAARGAEVIRRLTKPTLNTAEDR